MWDYLGHKHQYITAQQAHELLRLTLTVKCKSLSSLCFIYKEK